MSIFKQKLKGFILIISLILLALCLTAVFFSISGLFNAKLTVDYVSNAFLIVVNAIIIYSLINFILYSNYRLTDKKLVIKTAYFKDPVEYDKIKKIYYFATEDELYLQLEGGEENIIKINLTGNDINNFANELKKRVPDIPYEVSLRMDSDLE